MRAARILALTWLALMAMTLGTFRAGTEGAATAGVVLAIATLKAHLIAAVFMELLSFENFAFRSKKAVDLGLVGKTMEECRLIWADAVVVGVIDTRIRLDPKIGLQICR